MIDGYVDDLLDNIQCTINAADISIPKTSCTPRHRKPWWNSKCQAGKKINKRLWAFSVDIPIILTILHIKKQIVNLEELRRKSQS